MHNDYSSEMCCDDRIIVSYYRWLQNGLKPEKIDVSLITHLILGFCVVKDDGTIGEGETHGERSYSAVVALKKKNPKLKVLISVGGGGNHAGFVSMVKNDDLLNRFVNSAVSLIEQHSLDGLDLDWEFPSGSREKTRFVVLLEHLRDAFDKHPMRPILTVAVPAQSPLVNSGYDVPKIAKTVDLVLIMTYDLHMYKWYLPFTGHNAPLMPGKKEFCYFKTLNIRYSAKMWAKRGVPKKKLVVGVPTYGLTWKLLFKWWRGSWAPAVGIGPNGGYTSYPKVLNMLSTNSGRAKWDKISHTPYVITSDKTWISYDDQDSIRAKVKFIREAQYAGVMCFSLNCDDWGGECGRENFPLHKTIHSELLLTDRL
ncbi:chitotriosidase-1-like isoform X2 [Varroa jacobsoni]|uniref:GH18 domain-containing protein n=1 Tax=Varroa destructor TaxID=109461 RepID=A0A7M7M5Q8_VARDE|nr:chitotriosidase-1-like isoform X2 [Varroa destructor]XP_022651299.1 chitotriosidase-1-like isoform X2 [Varroa destructor]XP_022651300.1 chitotriosidase-1-like isoform X2 [Varroa destructor]XP_022651301.1 chitotriosidase-1-like isoform X2 [Varroa destructor]XP_022709388.1 chitotriosidase-1-like isoform X2 [Varroa jacobsoni]XP_022709389.1 chitotriosidase-1-like isoform X2 [Varroa jacobsoni]